MAIAPDHFLREFTLDDKYSCDDGQIYLSGVQALVRLMIEQRKRDRAAGLNTGGFVSGYRGSPLGTLDNFLWQQEKRLRAHDIVFQPGLNEDLAATSLWGTQQVAVGSARSRVDGVFGMWYGKGPGVDRSLDVLKHANLAGTAPHGGVLAVAGDDHYSQSSTLAHQSEQTFIAAMIPVLNPASVQEYLDFGLLGFALSRFSGCWVGFKAVAETVESSASVHINPLLPQIVLPTDFEAPSGGLHIRWPDPPLVAEARLHGAKMNAVAAFVRANGIDRLISNPASARLGIITTGKAYLDVRQGLIELGLADRLDELGIRLYKVGMPWPLEAEGALRFADGLTEILVIEEKQGLIQDQLSRILYNMPSDRRPLIVGKRDENGRVLIKSEGQIGATDAARAIYSRLVGLGFSEAAAAQRISRLETFEISQVAPGTSNSRTPIFCSGCPHNTSTRVPEGSRAGAGIGCHSITTMIPERKTETYTHMGGEGANWIGQAPFSQDNHLFQNLGDGTYAHSGLMAIRAAVASGVNITYKILYNDAVAMTGGQPAEGSFTVAEISRQVAAENVKKIVVVSDNPDQHGGAGYAPGVSVYHRDRLDEVQRDLRDTSGTTVLIYEQTCAAEKRRRRKRGKFPDPAKRIFINPEVCEGCGDCSEASNCVSVVPLETELGRKRAIDQSSCNKDYSCIKGFCPSFLIVEGGKWVGSSKKDRQFVPEDPPMVPEPKLPPLYEPYNVLIAGVGGTGVVTVGALLGVAAHLEGKDCTVSDFTGLSQKGGAVMSHVRLAESPDSLHSVRIAPGGADLMLAYDPVVATGSEALSRLEHGVSRALVNRYVAPTAGFLSQPDMDFEQARMTKRLRDLLGSEGVEFVDASHRAEALLGDAIASNLFLLGMAYQRGLIPVGAAAIEKAITINGAAVTMNRRAFGWGRVQAHDPGLIARMLVIDERSLEDKVESLEDVIAGRAARLADYQDQSYAQRFLRSVERARSAEKQVDSASSIFTTAVAQSLYKLMAYKDEYEVARLHVATGFSQQVSAQFEGKTKISFSMAPPLFAKRDPASGRLIKKQYGPWMIPVLKLLAMGKRLRGTRLDPFGYLADRKMERRLVVEFEATVASLSRNLSRENIAVSAQIAALPLGIKGYGHVKDRNLDTAKAEEVRLLQSLG